MMPQCSVAGTKVRKQEQIIFWKNEHLSTFLMAKIQDLSQKMLRYARKVYKTLVLE